MTHGTRLDSGGVPSKLYPEGRRCPTCRAVLSLYNPGPYCYTHRLLPPPAPAGRASAVKPLDS